MSSIYRAKAEDIDILTELAIRSEAYWGFDLEVLERYKVRYRLTTELINTNPTYVYITGENVIIGFFTITSFSNVSTLEYFYIEPSFIGKGYGKHMWQELIKVCKAKKIEELTLLANPEAKGFYLKQGASVIGEVASVVMNNRMLPKLHFTIN